MVVRWSGERQEKVKSQFELDIGGRETCKNAINPLTAALSPVLEQHPLLVLLSLELHHKNLSDSPGVQ